MTVVNTVVVVEVTEARALKEQITVGRASRGRGAVCGEVMVNQLSSLTLRKQPAQSRRGGGGAHVVRRYKAPGSGPMDPTLSNQGSGTV